MLFKADGFLPSHHTYVVGCSRTHIVIMQLPLPEGAEDDLARQSRCRRRYAPITITALAMDAPPLPSSYSPRAHHLVGYNLAASSSMEHLQHYPSADDDVVERPP